MKTVVHGVDGKLIDRGVFTEPNVVLRPAMRPDPASVTARTTSDGPARSAVTVEIRHERLVDSLVDFAILLTEDPPIVAVIDSLIQRTLTLVPVDAVGASVGEPNLQLPSVRASGRWGMAFESFQARSGEGPNWACHTNDHVVSVPDLMREERFPRFGLLGTSAGLLSVFTVPLHHGDMRWGTLSLYRRIRGDMSDAELGAVRRLADVGAGYLVSTHRRLAVEAESDLSRHFALHDPLTGLPNRALMIERLRHACDRSRRTGQWAAVLYLDLDGFKAVNDSFGHAVGDELLVAVTRRLASLLRPADTLARLHGDEFVLLCEDLTEPGQARLICHRLQDVLDEPLAVGQVRILLSASIGVVITDQDTGDATEVLRDADAAMYEAKRQGGSRFWVHDPRSER